MATDRFDIADPECFESDRETLPFPQGGVFGRPENDQSDTDVTTTDDVIGRVVRTLDEMQGRLDELDEDVEHVLRLPPLDDFPRPAA